MDIFTPSISPGTNTQPPLAKELHGQATKNGRVKTAESVRFIPKEDSESQGAEQSRPRDISPQDRTVIEFSKFCSSSFYSKTGSRSCKLPDEPYYRHSHITVSDFCSLMRIFSHTHKGLFRDITDTIGVNSDDEDETIAILKKLVHSEEYNNIKGIEAARNAIPVRVKAAPHAVNSEASFLRCPRSARMVPRRFREDALTETTSPDRSKDRLRSEKETSSLPIKRRKATCSKKPNTGRCKIRIKSERERLNAVKDIIKACLKEPTSKKDIENTMKLIFRRSNHWQDLSSLRTSMKRWFNGLKPSMTQGFEEEEIKQAEEVFSRLIGVYPPSGKK